MTSLVMRIKSGIVFGVLAIVSAAWAVVPPMVSAEDVGEKAKASLQKAHDQLKVAIEQAETALGPHRKGSGWVRTYMQRTLNVLGGTMSPDYFDKHEAPFLEKVGNPGDGHGALMYLEEARQALKDTNAPASLQEAIDRAVSHLSDAVDHARESVHGTGLKQTHGHADKVAALLVAAHGKGDTDSPVTGTLAYAMKHAGLTMTK